MDRLIAPSTDFRSVRDGRNAQVFYVDVDLSTARSAAATTGLVLPISGNSFYCDANPSDGNAFVRFQDTNFDRAPVPLYVSPGVIFNIPYTKVMIENSAQPGKKIRIAYGIDVDFQPGSVAQIAVTNNGGFTSIRTEAQTAFFSSQTLLVANTPDTIFTPAANTNGALLLSANFNIGQAANGVAGFITKASAPTTVLDGSPVLMSGVKGLAGTALLSYGDLQVPQFIAAGQGLYYISSVATATSDGYSFRGCRYRLL
jgi:hypothetical protein